ncbi:MAG: tRNA pseudouridine(55) synthase TruB [Solirubrobacterales bacterium]|nr:tRNA pseudouridine(55) synthase TruB [Solirubrobacterales bacterium]MBV8942970.1 tRNA pseudouridine(55) synthase TruB [Solirubrobacterales bacterium]MBV9167263.1 tRNA pseudouridine(55) synthase TruB [Solirubrobacterales bacterium]MBV9534686.1 tRNA pseudouridine(55) synthase TruB [Solirubrobacterales bacterium]
MRRDGLILLDKPEGISSAAAVAGIRQSLERRAKVGHGGALDPFATGLLLILLGRATRVQRFLLMLPKTYEVTARFGARSSTGDPEGEIIHTGRVPEGDLRLPTGTVRQRPPAFSALKVSGHRAYKLARAGAEVELPERDVHVHRFEERWRDGDRRGFEIECSSGTYIRSLVADLGDAYCETLRRTRIGPFVVAEADPERVLGLDETLSFLPAVRLCTEAARSAAHGGAVAGTGLGPVRLVDERGLIAVAEPAAAGMLRPVVVLRG